MTGEMKYIMVSDFNVSYFRFHLIYVCMTMPEHVKKVHLLFKVTKQIYVATCSQLLFNLLKKI